MTDKPMNASAHYIPGLRPVYSTLSEWAYLLLRIFAGGMLIPHGGQKLFNMFGGTHEGVVGFFTSIGLEPAEPLVYLVGIGEFFGGILIVIGLFTRVAAAYTTVTMAVAALYVHLANGLFVQAGGVELTALWAAALLFIAVHGGGRFSVDAAIGREF